MLSASNLEALTEAGYTYIVGSRLHKVPYNIAEYQKTGELSDEQIMVTRQEGYRVIYQYRAKRAALDLRNIDKQVAKAKKALSGQIPANRTKLLTKKAKSKQLNQKLIDKARELAALAISSNIEYQTGISIKQFVKLIRPLRSGIVTFNGEKILAEPEVPGE